MKLSEPISPRTHPAVSYDISAHPQAALPQVKHTEPDRVQQKLDDLAHRLDMVEGNLQVLAEALNGNGHH